MGENVDPTKIIEAILITTAGADTAIKAGKAGSEPPPTSGTVPQAGKPTPTGRTDQVTQTERIARPTAEQARNVDSPKGSQLGEGGPVSPKDTGPLKTPPSQTPPVGTQGPIGRTAEQNISDAVLGIGKAATGPAGRGAAAALALGAVLGNQNPSSPKNPTAPGAASLAGARAAEEERKRRSRLGRRSTILGRLGTRGLTTRPSTGAARLSAG